jgi:hypothetical protein
MRYPILVSVVEEYDAGNAVLDLSIQRILQRHSYNFNDRREEVRGFILQSILHVEFGRG